jgi:ergothioneine biosynthesis protein EgtB
MEILLSKRFLEVRARTENICKPLQTEDYVVQPVADVSPPKWHLGHTAWFFEVMLLKPYLSGYKEFDVSYDFVFNSYYETVGTRVIRTDRGNLSRPTVRDVYRYRKYVDKAMLQLIAGEPEQQVNELITLGLNHEEQHQELLLTDIKYILGHNPLFPPYDLSFKLPPVDHISPEWISQPEGIYTIGSDGTAFAFDNERQQHRVYLNEFKVSPLLVTNEEYLEFMKDGGYSDFRHWHAAGWDWVNKGARSAPLYWHNLDGQWLNYTLNGLLPVDLKQPVCHVSYYEAWAFASWKGARLPTEAEWETTAVVLNWGQRWEWTESAYLPYPGFSKAPGALGEYNGKFMVDQQVLRGASMATPAGHSRITYRNFFQPQSQWQFTGIRLAK